MTDKYRNALQRIVSAEIRLNDALEEIPMGEHDVTPKTVEAEAVAALKEREAAIESAIKMLTEELTCKT